MAQEGIDPSEQRPRGRKRRIARNALLVLLALLLVVVGYAWIQRKQIADDFIAQAFADEEVRASYRIESIGPGRQVLTDIVIGDPALPDLTVERMEVFITPRLGVPDVTEIRLTRPRIYGSYRAGQLSFGDLDPFIFTGSDEPFEFPSLRLSVDDGRGLLDTDYGRVGLKLSGSGHLRGGFAGELAAVAPQFAMGGCEAQSASLYGEIAIDAERPEFHGPLRFTALDCTDTGLAVRDAGVELDVQAERNLAEFDGRLAFAASSVAVADLQAALRGEGQFAWHDNDLTLQYDLAANDAVTPYVTFGALGVEGRLRGLDSFDRVEIDTDISGEDLRMGSQLDGAIADAAEAGEGTLAAPLLNKLGLNLARELRGSSLAANVTVRKLGERTSVVIPEARLQGGSGATIFALSRAQLALSGVGGEEGLPRFTGNFATGGDGLPQVSGRMEQVADGDLQLRMAMREYAAGDSRLALPRLALTQRSDGSLALEGRVLASGALPGGAVSGLELPLDGTVASNGDIALWSGCRDVRFDRLALANLSLARQSLTLCPQRGAPILRYGANGVQFAAGGTRLQLRGELADTPIRIASGPFGVAYPGALVARDLDIVLGPADNAQRFTITDLRADLSGANIGGDFSGADVFLASVPLDVLEASGEWSYVGERFVIDGAAFTLEDRESVDRFEPVTARGATLALADNVITANATLRHPATDTALARVLIDHDLGNGSGHADLIVDGVSFGPNLQPAPPVEHCFATEYSDQVVNNGLTCLALGVVSAVEGTLSGTGRIDWNADGVTSSGEFSSTSLDLAAAFGPVRGASGTVVFTDLLGLTTAPNQRIAVRSVNPGIEVFDGEVAFQLVGGELLRVEDATWPFMGGTLTMRPVNLRFGEPEARRYVLVIEGLNAAQFVEHMELGNIAATGIFDGEIPIVFDEQGNGKLEGGYLSSRPPGGHVAYVGELTYEDMGFFANYAFRTLRDLQYERMEVLMNGPLTGELVTQVRFNRIRQGETAERNIVSRVIGNLPLELRVNVRAPFAQLMSSLRSLYDPASVRDPRSLGLLTDDGVRLREVIDQATVDQQDAAAEEAEAARLRGELNEEEPGIQPQESE